MDFSTVSTSTENLFDIGDSDLNWLYSASLLGVVISMIPYSYLVHKYNYCSYGLGIVLVVASSWIRYVSVCQKSYLLAVTSSVLLGCGNAVALVLYGPIPFTWFEPKDRSLALSVSVQSNYAGWCLGAILVPHLVTSQKDFEPFMFWQAIVVSLNLVFFIAFYRESPRIQNDQSGHMNLADSPIADMDEDLIAASDNTSQRDSHGNQIPIEAPTPMEMCMQLLRNRNYLLHTFCVTVLGGLSFTVSAVVDLVVTDDARFSDQDAAWLNTAYILSGVISGVVLGMLVKQNRNIVGRLLMFLFFLGSLALSLVAVVGYLNKHVEQINQDLLFAIFFVLFSAIGLAALGFCGISLSLAITAATTETDVKESFATTIPELGLNAFGALTTQVSGVDTGFFICGALAWVVAGAMIIFYKPLKYSAEPHH